MLATYAPRVAAHPTRTGVERSTDVIRVLVVHTSEGGEGPDSAEGLARFIATPRTETNLASYHYIADHDRVIPCVPDDHVAYANAGANHDGLSICHPGKAAQTTDQWADAASSAQLEQVARWLADKADEYGIPLVKISATQLVNGASGVCGHVDVTKAYKRSTHTDPGPNYPWSQVIARARQLVAPPVPPSPPYPPLPPIEENEMTLIVRDRTTGETWCSNGVVRYRWPSHASYEAAVFVAQLQGQPLPPPVDVDPGQLVGFGVAVN